MAARPVPQPPFSPSLLADLHGDNVEPEVAAALWPQVRHDAEALRILHSLDDVTAELRALGTSPHILHPMPEAVAGRLDRLLDELAQVPAEPAEPLATVHQLPVPDRPDLPADRERPSGPEPRPDPAATAPQSVPSLDARRRRRWYAALAAAAAAVVLVAGTLLTVNLVRQDQPAPTALPTHSTGSVELGDDLPAATLLSAMGRSDITGPLADPGALRACLVAAGLDRTVLGGTNATYHGRPAVEVLLTGPKPPKITGVILDARCTADSSGVLAAKDIG